MKRAQDADVLVLAPTVLDPDAFGLAEYVLQSRPTTAVVIVKDRAPNGLLPAAIRAGVRDVVDLSKGAEDLRDSLERALDWSSKIKMARETDGVASPETRGTIISVFSSKGGTGKTFLTSNLGAAIAVQTQQDTAVVDLDFDLGDVFSYFGREPGRPLRELVDMAR